MVASANVTSIDFSGVGATSRQKININITLADKGHGIVFELSSNGKTQIVPANCNFVVNTLRNVVLGKDGLRLCIVEHFLAAVSLWGLNDLLVKVDGPEMPLGDGSAKFWIDLFAEAGWKQQTQEPSIKLNRPIVCQKGDRLLMAVPDEKFSVSYHMDWDHPLIGKRWQGWNTNMEIAEVANARTFGWLKEQEMLGLADQVVSLTPDGFTQPLRFEDEPVRHKLLDLIGDLRLSGVNPMSFKAKFISIKAGHELDIEMAKQLALVII